MYATGTTTANGDASPFSAKPTLHEADREWYARLTDGDGAGAASMTDSIVQKVIPNSDADADVVATWADDTSSSDGGGGGGGGGGTPTDRDPRLKTEPQSWPKITRPALDNRSNSKGNDGGASVGAADSGGGCSSCGAANGTVPARRGWGTGDSVVCSVCGRKGAIEGSSITTMITQTTASTAAAAVSGSGGRGSSGGGGVSGGGRVGGDEVRGDNSGDRKAGLDRVRKLNQIERELVGFENGLGGQEEFSSSSSTSQSPVESQSARSARSVMGDVIRAVAMANPDNGPVQKTRPRTNNTPTTKWTKEGTWAAIAKRPISSTDTNAGVSDGLFDDHLSPWEVSTPAPPSPPSSSSSSQEVSDEGTTTDTTNAALAAAKHKPWRKETGIPYTHTYTPPPPSSSSSQKPK